MQIPSIRYSMVTWMEFTKEFYHFRLKTETKGCRIMHKMDRILREITN